MGASRYAGVGASALDASFGASPVFVAAHTPHSAATNFADMGGTTNDFALMRRVSAGLQNDSVEWTVRVAAGTHTLTLLHTADANIGIYTVAVDEVDVGTIDGYAAAPAKTASAIAGIVLAAGEHRVRFTMATKNASSSNYYGVISAFILTRTGA